MRLRRLAVTALMSACGALAFAGSAQACSCAPMAPEEAMRRADAAIAGWLVKVVPQGRSKAEYRYRVQRVYKRGPGIRRGRVISVLSARDSAECGLPTRTERRYRLALARGKERWVGGLCGLLSYRCAS